MCVFVSDFSSNMHSSDPSLYGRQEKPFMSSYLHQILNALAINIVNSELNARE